MGAKAAAVSESGKGANHSRIRTWQHEINGRRLCLIAVAARFADCQYARVPDRPLSRASLETLSSYRAVSTSRCPQLIWRCRKSNCRLNTRCFCVRSSTVRTARPSARSSRLAKIRPDGQRVCQSALSPLSRNNLQRSTSRACTCGRAIGAGQATAFQGVFVNNRRHGSSSGTTPMLCQNSSRLRGLLNRDQAHRGFIPYRGVPNSRARTLVGTRRRSKASRYLNL